jgi:hypothetical protein
MIAGTLYVRVVAQDKDRGYMLLAGFDPAVIQRTAAQYTTLSDPTRATLDAAIARMQKLYSASEVKDVTASAVVKKLAKLFGETGQPTPHAPEPVFAKVVEDKSFAPSALAALSDTEFYEKLKSMV